MTHNDPRHRGERLLLPGGLKQHRIKSSDLHKHGSAVTYGGAIHQRAVTKKKRLKDVKDAGMSWVRGSRREERGPDRSEHVMSKCVCLFDRRC